MNWQEIRLRIRNLDYRDAVNAFVFTALWFVIGAIVLWSPVPDALGIGGDMFAVWLMLFFLLLAIAGSVLTTASLNELFPVSGDAQAIGPMSTHVATPSGPSLWAAKPTQPRRARENASRES